MIEKKQKLRPFLFFFFWERSIAYGELMKRNVFVGNADFCFSFAFTTFSGNYAKKPKKAILLNCK